MANEIAELIINKTFWGNEWFALFSLLLVGLVAAGSAWAGTYLSTRSQNAAIRADFKNALRNLEIQTNSVKHIEESVAHEFIEKRELHKVRRTKMEELYLALATDLDHLAHNLNVATTDAGRDMIFLSNRAEMLAFLYFKEEFKKEIDYFQKQRGVLTTRIRQLCEENLDQTAIVSKKRIEESIVFFNNYNQAKVNIEIGLEAAMSKLTRP
ncbi:MAG: hypothetical protein V3T17_11875 [Pseudomonadales bacterium]